jgi:uncharacterized membrane protein
MASDQIQPTDRSAEPASVPSPIQPEGQIVSFHQQIRYSGPLPSPEILAGYEQAFKGCAERIIAMAERQAKHRQECERLRYDAPIEDARASRIEARRGQFFAFTLVIAAFAISAGMVLISPTPAVATVATAISGSTILGVVGIFIVGRKTSSPKGSASKSPISSD